MRPRSLTLNMTNGSSCNAKDFANLSMREIAFFRKFANLPNIVICKFRLRVFFTSIRPNANRKGMAHVIAWGKIFEVIKSVVRWVAILVVNFKFFWTGTKKSSCYNSWNRGNNIAWRITKADVVPINFGSPCRRFKYAPRSCAHSRCISSNSSEIRDAVGFLKPHYWLPSFGLFHIGSLSYLGDMCKEKE